MTDLDVSIIISSCSRPKSLGQTLESIATVRVPRDWNIELIVVNNGVRPEIRKAVEAAPITSMEVRYLSVPTLGKSHALNQAMGEARGRALLFTDDDLLLPREWIVGMCAPILCDGADGIAGGVKLAPHLIRPWFKDYHHDEFADTFFLDPERPHQWVGANMAFARSVLKQIPAFDTELGPGAMGYYDDSLFAWQMINAGCRFQGALDIEAEHHFEESRLLRHSFIKEQIKRGQSAAYLDYHWRHQSRPNARLKLYERKLRLAYGRLTHPAELCRRDGITEWELMVVRSISYLNQYLRELKRPRKYDKFGLVKLESGGISRTSNAGRKQK